MKHTKCIYVLTSNEADYYLEQLVISVRSLRLYHPDVYIGVLVDRQTNETIKDNRLKLLHQVTEIIEVETPQNYSQMQRSRFIKTSVRNIVDGDFLFIDTDTVICGDLSDIENYKEDICAVPDLHVPVSNHTYTYDIAARAKIVDWDISQPNCFYFNSGIIYVKDRPSTKEFYSLWNKLWTESMEHGCSSDQPAFCKANVLCGGVIAELPGVYNCQIVENGLRYLVNAKIIHYFASNMKGIKNIGPFLLKDNALYANIRQSGEIDDVVVRGLISNPKNAFTDKVQLISEQDVDFFNSPICQYLRKFYYRFPVVYNGVIKGIRAIKRKL